MRPVVLRARAMPVMTRAQAADAAARQQHETLGGLIAQLRQLERDVGSEAYVVYYTSRADAGEHDRRARARPLPQLQVRKGANRNPSRRPGLAVSDSNLHAVKTGHC